MKVGQMADKQPPGGDRGSKLRVRKVKMLKNQGIKERVIRKDVSRRKGESTVFRVIQQVGRLLKLNDCSLSKPQEEVQHLIAGLIIPPISLARFKESLLI